MSTPLIHLYAGFAMVSDGKTSLRINLTDEQIVQLAADANELAAKILRWGVRDVHRKDNGDADSGLGAETRLERGR